MPDKLFCITGDEAKSLLTNTNSLKISSSPFSSPEDLKENWGHSSSETHETEINYSAIDCIIYSVLNRSICIIYKTSLDEEMQLDFAFKLSFDFEKFLQCFENELGFIRTQKALAITNIRRQTNKLLIGTLIFITPIFILSLDKKLLNEAGPGPRSEGFKVILKSIGPGGVLFIGLALIVYILFRDTAKMKDPPVLTMLVPSGS
jgi:hypothetical protein